MTLIVANREAMAADTLCVFEDGTHYHAEKMARMNGGVVGAAGESHECFKFFRWFADQSQDKPEMGENFEALFLDEGGIYYIDTGLNITRLYNPFYAIGCGKLGGLAVLESGGTLREAIEITAKHNNAVGGDPEVIYLAGQESCPAPSIYQVLKSSEVAP